MNIITAKCVFIGSLLTVLTACGGTEDSSESAELMKGEKVVAALCINCHAAGLNGAPIIGNEKMWGKRLPQGVDTLIEHATNGYELMPAKGGNSDLTDEEVAAAVRYMVSQVSTN